MYTRFTPACNRCMALLWRSTWQLITGIITAGFFWYAITTYFLRILFTPALVSFSLRLLKNKGEVLRWGSRRLFSRMYLFIWITLSSIMGIIRLLFPFPITFIVYGLSSLMKAGPKSIISCTLRAQSY